MTAFLDPSSVFDFGGIGANRLDTNGVDTTSDDFSPDNWLVTQVDHSHLVEQLPTPPSPLDGISTKNEPHTVPAPQAAMMGLGGAVGVTGSIGAAIDKAMSWVGSMYDWGGNGQNGRGVDCSGLLYSAFRSAGFNTQRYRAVDYGHMGAAIGAEDARPGDIVYFDEPGDTDHVGLYIGNGQMIESPHTGAQVRVSSLKGRGGQFRRVLPQSAYRGLPRDAATGATQYVAPSGQSFAGAASPGPQYDPLDILHGLDAGQDANVLMGLPAELQQGIAAQTPLVDDQGKPAAHPADTFGKFLNAVSGQESGGDYHVVNSIGAIGKYQVMTANVGAWTLGALGHTLSPEQFRNSPEAQEAVARWRLGSLVAKYGYRGAAAAWYSGQAKRQNDYSHVGNGPSVGDYVDQVMGRM
jgi:cell wall-associated NlpC family hydrolase